MRNALPIKLQVFYGTRTVSMSSSCRPPFAIYINDVWQWTFQPHTQLDNGLIGPIITNHLHRIRAGSNK